MYCGIPEGNLPSFSWASFASAGLSVRGSNVGSKKEVLEMLELVAREGGEKWWSWVQVEEMGKVGETLEKVERGEVRYRWVMKN